MTAKARSLAIISVVSAAFAAGCATTDPAGDIRTSAAQVEDRTDVRAAWPATEELIRGDAYWAGETDLIAKQAVALALAGNAALRADLADIAAARADFAQAQLPANPVANVMAAWNVDSAASMLTAGVMQSLSSLWLLPARKQAAQARLQQAVLQTADNAIALASRVEQSHRRIVFLQRLLPVLAERRRLLALAEKAADVKLQAGLGSSLDVNRVRTEMLELQAEQRTVQSDLDIEKRKLLEMINRADAPADWSAAAEPDDANSAPDEPGLVKLARENRLDLLAATWAVRARQAKLSEARLEVPDVALGAATEREKPTNGSTMVRAGPAVEVELPIFDRGQARIAKAQAELNRARMEALAADQRAALEVRQARETLQTAARQWQAYREEIVPLAEKNVVDAQSAFEAGDLDLLDLLTAQRDVTRARAMLLKFHMERDLAWIDLARAVGGRTILESLAEQ